MSPHLPHTSSHDASRFAEIDRGTCAASAAEQWRAREVHWDEAPEIREQLEALDDVMFAAIGGDSAALEQARGLWSDASCQLPPALIDEAREQYLRYAAEVTRRYKSSELRDPTTSIMALEMFELLARD
jgi:hypothetical protein